MYDAGHSDIAWYLSGIVTLQEEPPLDEEFETLNHLSGNKFQDRWGGHKLLLL